MFDYTISNKEYEDGCFEGIFQLMNPKAQELEIYTFVYDKEVNSLSLKRRIASAWESPMHDEGLSDYALDNYLEIKNLIIAESEDIRF